MKIQVLHEAFSICRLRRMPAAGKRWHFLAVTDEEISLVCPTAEAPKDAEKRDDGWRAFRVEGTLDFSLVGILADLSSRLAAARIGLLAVSTYNTDYILTKDKDFDRALAVLTDAGYAVEPLPEE